MAILWGMHQSSIFLSLLCLAPFRGVCEEVGIPEWMRFDELGVPVLIDASVFTLINCHQTWVQEVYERNKRNVMK